MSQTQDSSRPKFLHVSDWRDLEDLLDSPHQLQTELARQILDGFFNDWFGYQTELPGLKTYLAWRIAGDLLGVIEEKLKRHHPHGAARKTRAIQLEQALAYLKDIWTEDWIKHPGDPLAKKCQRILRLLKQWPGKDMRARPEHGLTSQLWHLGIYEDVEDRLEGLPRGPVTIGTRDQRKDFLKSLFHEVDSVYGRKQRYVFHPKTKEIFLEASEQDIDRWSKLPGHKIAEEITSKVLDRTGVHITPNYLHRILPKLRKLASRIEQAKRLQKSK